MDYIGGISNFNYNPIKEYNNALNSSHALNAPVGTGDISKADRTVGTNTASFDDILTQETEKGQGNTDMDNFMSKMGGAFSDGLNSVNNDAVYADKTQEILASGGDISAHEVMIAAEKSNLSLQMALQIRNKLVNAYSEINNMQV